MDYILAFINSIKDIAIPAFVGTWAGAYIIIWRQESKLKYPRKLMTDILDLLGKYDSYQKAESDFNNRSAIEKKAVLVALKKLGVPVQLNILNDAFDIDNVKLGNEKVSSDTIIKMKEFVKKGLCDDLFFKEIESNFYSAPPKIIFARNLALTFLDALATQGDDVKLIHVVEKAAKMNWNQFEIIQVFYNTVDFTSDKKISVEKINAAKTNVNNGVFDHLFYWDIRAFNNMNSQRNVADILVNASSSILSSDAVSNKND
ncbi:hypothetical protein CK910_21450 [Aeromonas sp. CA23]|uniref:hypothetical protein n=1 Tax=Aeromonas sp. CA23 TaxID=2033032 RepID=UPI000BFBB945|nr:hypothetical protein [Aeromonas sp. CA23]ATM00747.1 hypothetical protein CK910_21450 [Aeromonas sp. CA23]